MMPAKSKGDREPLLSAGTTTTTSTSTTQQQLGSNLTGRLNPRAASFKFEPKGGFTAPNAATPSSSKPKPQAPSYAAVASREPAAEAPIHELGSAPPAKATRQPVQEAREEAATEQEPLVTAQLPTAQPTSANASSIPTDSPALSSHIISTTTSAVHSRRPSVPSISDASTASSESSCCILPSRRQFIRAHILQYALTALLTLAFFAGTTAWCKKEIRVWEFFLGAAAWLAGEQLKESSFELLRWPKTGAVQLELDEEAGERYNDGEDEDEEEDGEEEATNRDASPSSSSRRRASRSPAQRGLILPTIIHAFLQELLRLGAIFCLVALLPDPIDTNPLTTISMPPPPAPPRHRGREGRHSLPPLDTLFFSALWMALGWAVVEIVWASRDMWQMILMYEDVLAEEELKIAEAPIAPTHYGSNTGAENHGSRVTMDKVNGGSPQFLTSSAFDRVAAHEHATPRERELLEMEVDARIRAVEREEIEGQLGVPLYEIPVAVVIVWRLDSILLALVLTLTMSLPFRTTSPSLVAFPLWPTFAFCAATHALLSLMWLLRVRYVGIPSISYATLVILLALTFGSLAAWGALE